MYYPENSPSTVVLNVGLTGPYIVTLEEESVVSKLMVLASEIKFMMLELKAIVSKIIDAGTHRQHAMQTIRYLLNMTDTRG